MRRIGEHDGRGKKSQKGRGGFGGFRVGSKVESTTVQILLHDNDSRERFVVKSEEVKV